MSRTANTLRLNRSGIETLPVKEEVKVWLRNLVDELDENNKLVRDFLEAGGFATKSWRGREATAADVTAGDAAAEGNLITVHKTSGTKREVEA